jgi:hypothetical protein
MKIIFAALIATSLGGCASTPQVLTKEKLVVVEPDRSMYNCPAITRYPNPDTLTDVEVAKLLVAMERTNSECKRNMKAIQNFIEQAKARSN